MRFWELTASGTLIPSIDPISCRSRLAPENVWPHENFECVMKRNKSTFRLPLALGFCGGARSFHHARFSSAPCDETIEDFNLDCGNILKRGCVLYHSDFVINCSAICGSLPRNLEEEGKEKKLPLQHFIILVPLEVCIAFFSLAHDYCVVNMQQYQYR